LEAEGFFYTAILAASDNLALGLLHELRSVGRRVPQDVSVVGFDDIPEAQITHPALTTVRQEHKLKGLLARRKLISLICKKTRERRGLAVQAAEVAPQNRIGHPYSSIQGGLESRRHVRGANRAV
jgi:DNA-binding LacI/PurR family transcriptional regulator